MPSTDETGLEAEILHCRHRGQGLLFLAGDSVARRSLDLFLVYTQSFQETVTTIEKEEITANLQL